MQILLDDYKNGCETVALYFLRQRKILQTPNGCLELAEALGTTISFLLGEKDLLVRPVGYVSFVKWVAKQKKLDAGVGVDARRLEGLIRAGAPDPVDVGQRDLDSLLARQVDAGNACHGVVLLCAPGGRHPPPPPVRCGPGLRGPGVAPAGAGRRGGC